MNLLSFHCQDEKHFWQLPTVFSHYLNFSAEKRKKIQMKPCQWLLLMDVRNCTKKPSIITIVIKAKACMFREWSTILVLNFFLLLLLC